MPLRQVAPSPPAFLFTDERVDEAALLRAARRLRPGEGIVLRHYRSDRATRARLYHAMRRIARRRGLLLFVAGDLPHRFADHDRRHGQGRRGGRQSLLSMPVHDTRELEAARRAGADIVFISPVFATRSHAGARPLGPFGYARLAAMAEARGMRPFALGGMTRARAAMLRTGFGAIDGLNDPSPAPSSP